MKRFTASTALTHTNCKRNRKKQSLDLRANKITRQGKNLSKARKINYKVFI